jgi:very-short-patch-repair endonuclease
VVPGTVDAYIPLWRLITEADGRRWHTRQADFERDRTRDNLATSHGIGVLRFTYQMLVRQPEQCLSTILATGRTRSQAS